MRQNRKVFAKNMKLMIDTNIILDVLQARELYVQTSSIIWKLCETNQADGFISTLTFTNLVYVMRRELEPEKIEEVLHSIMLIFSFTDLNDSDLLDAAKLKWNDFEDALQSVTAKRIKADYIITRNVKDFEKSEVPALTPSELAMKLL